GPSASRRGPGAAHRAPEGGPAVGVRDGRPGGRTRRRAGRNRPHRRYGGNAPGRGRPASGRDRTPWSPPRALAPRRGTSGRYNPRPPRWRPRRAFPRLSGSWANLAVGDEVRGSVGDAVDEGGAVVGVAYHDRGMFGEVRVHPPVDRADAVDGLVHGPRVDQRHAAAAEAGPTEAGAMNTLAGDEGVVQVDQRGNAAFVVVNRARARGGHQGAEAG